jgi:hypothetical protein
MEGSDTAGEDLKECDEQVALDCISSTNTLQNQRPAFSRGHTEAAMSLATCVLSASLHPGPASLTHPQCGEQLPVHCLEVSHLVPGH